jgi:hypothetical protein
MGILNYIRDRRYKYYVKKGMMQAIQELQAKHKQSEINKSRILDDFSKAVSIIKEEANTFSAAVDVMESKYGKHQEAEEGSTLFAYINLSALDIILIIRLLLRTNDPDEKNFLCRTAAQHMYEFFIKGEKIFGRHIKLYSSGLKREEVDTEVNNIRSAFYRLKDEMVPSLKELRHNVSAHKDRDIRKQLSLINTLSLDEFDLKLQSFMTFYASFVLLKNKMLKVVVEEAKKSSIEN